MLYLKYGDYSHDIGEAAVVISKQSTLDEAGRKIGWKEQWQVSGRLEGADPASKLLGVPGPDISEKIRGLEEAYSTNYKDLSLVHSMGGATAHKMLNADTISGVRIDSLSYPEGAGAEYSTFRSYSIVASAEFGMLASSGGSDGTVTFSQVISTQGTGGPRKVVLETRTGFPVVQYVSQRTPIYMTQSGFAVGYLSYPIPATPIDPQWEDLEKREIRYETPVRKGFNGMGTEFRVNWTYSFSKPG